MTLSRTVWCADVRAVSSVQLRDDGRGRGVGSCRPKDRKLCVAVRAQPCRGRSHYVVGAARPMATCEIRTNSR